MCRQLERYAWGYPEIVFDCNGVQHAHILTLLYNNLTNPIIIHTWILQILILHIFGLAHHKRLSSLADSMSTHTVPQRLLLLLFACSVCEATRLVIMLIIIQCILDELCVFASIFAPKISTISIIMNCIYNLYWLRLFTSILIISNQIQIYDVPFFAPPNHEGSGNDF